MAVSIIADALFGLKLGAEEIAEKSRLPLSRIQAILAGETAALSELRAISSGLRLPMHILASRERSLSQGSSLAPLFREVRHAADDYDITVEKIAAFVEAALDILPSRETLPSWLAGLQIDEESYPAADKIAKEIRALIYPDRPDEPATDLPQALGNLEGVVISRLLFSRYEGVSLIAGNYCFIFVSPRFVGRMLFTLGHELGHIVAHHKQGRAALFERTSEIGTFGKRSHAEAFVDAFSSCFLLPDVGLAKALKTFRDYYRIDSENITDFEILLLARFYGVSFEVAGRRCEDLEILPRGVTHTLSQQLKKDYGSPEKRADYLKIPPRANIDIPVISGELANALNRKISIGEVSVGWATDRLGLSIGELLASHAKLQTP